MNLIKPKIIEAVTKNTVVIESIQVDELSVSSGIIISPKHVLTAAHCLIGNTTVIKNKNRYPIIDVCSILPASGIALLTLKEPVFSQPSIKICNQVNPGEIIFWVTLLFARIQEAFFYGYLSASVTHEDGLTYYYTYGGFCHGMSGSGIYNAKGELIGMLTLTKQFLDENEKLMMGLVIPVEYFMPLIALCCENLIIKPKTEKELTEKKPIKTKSTRPS